MAQVVVIAVVVVYFLLMILIGAWANRRTSSSKEFLVAGQSLGFFVMAIATFSSIQSGWGMVGSTGTAYSWGPQALIAAAFLTPLGFALAWFLLACTRSDSGGTLDETLTRPMASARRETPNKWRETL